MAATVAYVAIVRVPAAGGVGEAVKFDNIGATTSAFRLDCGGPYNVSVKASTYGTVTLQQLAEDGVTWLTAATAFAADGTATPTLPPGVYRVALA